MSDFLQRMKDAAKADKKTIVLPEGYAEGHVQPSYDKQYVRDWLKANWDFTGDAPKLPADVLEGTSSRYQEAFQIITGTEFKPMKESNVSA